MNDTELAKNLEIWFRNNQNNKNRWCESLTGVVIKSNLRNFGNWKNAPRGNPQKGGIAAKKSKLEKSKW